MGQRRDPTDRIDELRSVADEPDLLNPIFNFRRRTVIRYMSLLPEDEAVGTTELAHVCSALEHGEPYHELSRHDYRTAYQALRSRDLKTLSIEGIIDKRDKDTIYRGEKFDRYARLVEGIDSGIDAMEEE